MTGPTQVPVTIVIVPENGDTILQVQQPHPIPEAFTTAIRSSDGMFWNSDIEVEDWHEQEDEEGLLMEIKLAGLWSLDLAIRWATTLARTLGRTLAIYQHKADYDNAPAYPVLFKLNGVEVDSAKALEVEYQKVPLTTHALGAFEVSQPQLRVTDPCYTVGTWCAGTLDVLPGTWHAQTRIGPTSWNARVHALQIHHASLGDIGVLDWSTLAPTELNAGVDSGQCGFFDDALFPRDEKEFEYEDGRFYSDCCTATLNRTLPGGATIRNFGVVSSSGFGDGGYPVYVQRNEAGDIILAQLLFVNETEDDEDIEE